MKRRPGKPIACFMKRCWPTAPKRRGRCCSTPPCDCSALNGIRNAGFARCWRAVAMISTSLGSRLRLTPWLSLRRRRCDPDRPKDRRCPHSSVRRRSAGQRGIVNCTEPQHGRRQSDWVHGMRHSQERPTEGEFAPFYAGYVSLVPESDIISVLERQPDDIRQQTRAFIPAHEAFRYAPEKWSVREVLGHMTDAERV